MVSAFDHLYGSRVRAQEMPPIMLCTWNNLAELGITGSIVVYNTENVENKEMIAARVLSSNADAKERGALVRRPLEEWKRANYLSDEYLQPAAFPLMEGLWFYLLYSEDSQQPGLRYVCSYWIGGRTVMWSWNMNRYIETAGSYTGIRTSPEMWQTDLSMSMKSIDTTGSVYRQNLRQGDWQQYMLCQEGDGCDVPTKERDLMKIDMLARALGFTYINIRIEPPTITCLSSYFHPLFPPISRVRVGRLCLGHGS